MRDDWKKWMAGILLVCIFVLSGCSFSDITGNRLQKYSVSFFDYFDTVSTIVGYADSEESFQQVSIYIEDRLKHFHELYDLYHTYDDVTNVAVLNEKAGDGPVKVDPDLFSLLQKSQEMYDVTDGKMNIAMGAVLKLWHECREEGIENPELAKLPDKTELESASAHCSIEDLILDKEDETVYFADPKLRLDVGAIAKGYATEMIARELIEQGVTGYSLDIGGNIRTIGTKGDGSDWNIGIQNPDTESSQTTVAVVSFHDKTLVTSGSYQRFYYVDGVKYHHIIDPDTLMPSDRWAGVSVLADDSGMADALSTACFNLSYEDGCKLIESLDQVEAMWVDPEGEIYYSKGFHEYQKEISK